MDVLSSTVGWRRTDAAREGMLGEESRLKGFEAEGKDAVEEEVTLLHSSVGCGAT